MFLLDCEDEIGGEIVRAWRGDDAVDNALATETHDDDQQATTVLAVAHPFLQCAAEVPGVFPYLAASFKDPPPEGLLLAIVVAAGRAASYTETGRIAERKWYNQRPRKSYLFPLSNRRRTNPGAEN